MTAAPASVAPGRRDPLPLDSRYECLLKIASGGMASVYVGRLRGAVGFWRLVAIKRAHAHLVEDPELRRMLIAEARLASKIHHPNTVAVLDVEELAEELLLVMDYVEGAALSELVTIAGRRKKPISPRVVARIAMDACAGLQAAHDLTDDDGSPLKLVHRDVSPQNLLVGVDGLTRVADFGIAKCTQSTTNATTTGGLKGKVAYMAPEYIDRGQLEPSSDVFALGVVLWEALTCERLFRGAGELETMKRVIEVTPPLVSVAAPGVGEALDAVIARALAKQPEERYATARELAEALEEAARKSFGVASAAEVGEFVKEVVGDTLDVRRAQLREMLSTASGAPRELTPVSRLVKSPANRRRGELPPFDSEPGPRTAEIGPITAEVGRASAGRATEEAGPVTAEIDGPPASERRGRSDDAPASTRELRLDGTRYGAVRAPLLVKSAPAEPVAAAHRTRRELPSDAPTLPKHVVEATIPIPPEMLTSHRRAKPRRLVAGALVATTAGAILALAILGRSNEPGASTAAPAAPGPELATSVTAAPPTEPVPTAEPSATASAAAAADVPAESAAAAKGAPRPAAKGSAHVPQPKKKPVLGY